MKNDKYNYHHKMAEWNILKSILECSSKECSANLVDLGFRANLTKTILGSMLLQTYYSSKGLLI